MLVVLDDSCPDGKYSDQSIFAQSTSGRTIKAERQIIEIIVDDVCAACNARD